MAKAVTVERDLSHQAREQLRKLSDDERRGLGANARLTRPQRRLTFRRIKSSRVLGVIYLVLSIVIALAGVALLAMPSDPQKRAADGTACSGEDFFNWCLGDTAWYAWGGSVLASALVAIGGSYLLIRRRAIGWLVTVIGFTVASLCLITAWGLGVILLVLAVPLYTANRGDVES